MQPPDGRDPLEEEMTAAIARGTCVYKVSFKGSVSATCINRAAMLIELDFHAAQNCLKRSDRLKAKADQLRLFALQAVQRGEDSAARSLLEVPFLLNGSLPC